MTQAKMPAGLMSPTIGYLPPGSKAWITPWTVAVDEDRNIWINADTPVPDVTRGGTAQLHLTRDDQGAFHAELYGNHRYVVTPHERIALGNYLPISTFTDARSNTATPK